MPWYVFFYAIQQKELVDVALWMYIDINLYFLIIFTQPLRSGRIWHKVNF